MIYAKAKRVSVSFATRKKLACLAVSVASAISPLVFAVETNQSKSELSQFPFWKTSAGIWLNEGTYLDGDLNYKISSYKGSTKVELSGSSVILTEQRFYPPGKFDAKALGLDIDPNAGVEFIRINRAEADGGSGRVKILHSPIGLTTSIAPLGDEMGLMRATHDASGLDAYRLTISLENQDYRHLNSLAMHVGEDKAGSYRALSYLQGRRVTEVELDRALKKWREQFNVRYLVSLDKGKHVFKEL